MKKIYILMMWIVATISMSTNDARGQQTFPRNGVLDNRVGHYALVNCRVVSPGKVTENAVILIEKDRIKAVGKNLNIPKGYRVVDLGNKSVYPAFFDAYTDYGLLPVKLPNRGNPVIKREQISPLTDGPFNANDAVRPYYDAVQDFNIAQASAEAMRSQGIGSVLSFRSDGVARGVSFVATLAETSEHEVVLKSRTAAHFSLERGSSLQDYPNTPMGAVSLLRQTYYDAAWYAQFDRKPFTDLALEAILSQKDLPQIFESKDWMFSLIGDKIADEFGLDYIIKGSGDEYQRIEEIKKTGRSFIIPVNFPKPFDVSDSLFTPSISLKDMKHWELAPLNPAYLEKHGIEFALTSHGLKDKTDFLTNVRQAVAAGLGRDAALEALTIVPAKMVGLEDLIGRIESGMLANLLVASGDVFSPESEIAEVWIQGISYPVEVRGKGKSDFFHPQITIDGDIPITYPFTAFGRPSVPKQEDILIKGATVWTNEAQGILEHTDVLVRKGKIAVVGQGLSAPGAKIIEANGRHLTPGIIDEHSHIALKGINEMATNTSMVRMEDVVNSEDVQIYRALAGGVVAAQLLHGSANAIGGQSAIVKFKWGTTPAEMLVREGAGFIKFALGENPKRSKSDPSIRFPRTVMGLEQVYTDAFTNALEYKKEWSRSSQSSIPKPRVDLVNEAMLEVLEGKRFISCHSYVQSEMLMLMDVAERFGIKVNTFTHVLEGYKIAEEMRAHGAGGSTFSDKWNFKWEARNAIPYNAVIMDSQGIVTAVNSDSGEVIRHLNQEAAKSIKYGDMDEESALKMITLNPAKLLHLDNTMGSIREGKSADLVLWSAHPLSIYAIAEKTMVEGVVYFDRQDDKQLQENIQSERNRLISLMGEAANQGVMPVRKSSEIHFDLECDHIGLESLLLNHH